MDAVKLTQEASKLQPEYLKPKYWYVISCSTFQVFFFRSTGTSFLLLFSSA